MNRKSLRAHLANHYEALTLSADRRDTIIDMVRSGEGQAAVPPLRAWWARAVPLAAAAAVLLALGIGLYHSDGQSDTSIALSEQVGRQIMVYHERYIDLDVTTGDFEAMKLAMDQLEFEPYKPAIINEKGLRLVGARYCAMYGCAAVQMRFVDDRGRHYTLYEVKPDERLRGAAATTVAVDDVPVKLWQEQGLLIGLAGPTL
jgi:hypothetical protein